LILSGDSSFWKATVSPNILSGGAMGTLLHTDSERAVAQGSLTQNRMVRIMVCVVGTRVEEWRGVDSEGVSEE
jgi:hypothetical protein